MEMHQIRYFLAMCETLNFTRAAERCNVPQPSLTRAIKLLEGELGGPLFNRERGNTHLTELGAMMRPHSASVVAQARLARTQAAALFALKNARLKVGLGRGVAP
jgi:LysR family transcriptional regulator, hydrogen peroxide-inducible genes activator